MAVKTYKPTTPARRGMTTADTAAITAKSSVKSLLVSKKAGSGRNNQGKITIRHRGGAQKRYYRLVDFRFAGAKGTVKAIEYDPNRSANIALIELSDGRFAYVLTESGMKVGQKISSGADSDIKAGNRLQIKNIPVGTQIFNIELNPGGGGTFVRAAGAKAQLAAKEGAYAQVKLPSGEVRLIHQDCMATIGTVGNEQHQNIKYGSAGRRRNMGWRPAVRGKAMNPVDHPHGGGEGNTNTDTGSGGPKTPWGKSALGLKTRRRKLTSKMIVRGRSEGRRR